MIGEIKGGGTARYAEGDPPFFYDQTGLETNLFPPGYLNLDCKT